MIFHVIGIGNKRTELPEQLLDLILHHHVFSGGQRHYELTGHLLPEGHQWIPIQSPMEQLFESYTTIDRPIIVFASGDPLFYGMANTLKTKYPEAIVHTYPYLSSIQLLVHRAGISSNHLQSVSVHGRSWAALDEVLIKQEPLIGVLTDREKSPSAIAKRLLYYGYDNYSVWIGEDLEGERERIREMQLEEAATLDFHPLNCVILKKQTHRDISFGIRDTSFEGLKGRPNMITKMPVRLCSLHALALQSKTVLWDLGFCTGSLSIEAKLRFPYLEIHAFEKRPECMQIIENNQRTHGTPGISAYTGDLFEFDFTKISRPDAVFIGGHGGRLPELLLLTDQYLLPGSTIVINAVQEDSAVEFISGSARLGWKLEEPLKLKVDTHNEITILKAIK